MKKNLTEIVFILDRSGSMAGLEDDTIGGFNAMIQKQKAEEAKRQFEVEMGFKREQLAEQKRQFDTTQASKSSSGGGGGGGGSSASITKTSSSGSSTVS